MPETSDRATLLAGRLLAGLEALRADRPADAVAPLREVVEDEELASAVDLRDIRARACTMLAQALVATDHPHEAGTWLDEAWALLAALGDRDGLAEVQGLRARRRDALEEQARHASAAARLARLAETPLEDLRSRAPSPAALQELLVQKVNAEVEAGRRAGAVPLAEEALAMARELGSVRGEVLARLSLARAAPERADDELTAAWRRAERADEFNLVGAVARTAEALGVALPVMVGPVMPERP